MNRTKAYEFLNGCNEDVDDFPNKLRSWLRTATIAHLNNPVNGGFTREQAIIIIEDWLNTEHNSHKR